MFEKFRFNYVDNGLEISKTDEDLAANCGSMHFEVKTWQTMIEA